MQYFVPKVPLYCLAYIHTHLAWISMTDWRKAEPQQLRLCTSMPILYSFNPIVSYSSSDSNSRMKLKSLLNGLELKGCNG